MIRSLYLFEDMGQLDQIKTAQLYSAACSVIRGVLYLQDIIDLLHGLTTYLLQSLYLSSCTLLRLLKTSFAKNLDTTSGEALFLSSVGLLQKLSIGNNAYHAKVYYGGARRFSKTQMDPRPMSFGYVVARL
jgi:hypothetical protein